MSWGSRRSTRSGGGPGRTRRRSRPSGHRSGGLAVLVVGDAVAAPIVGGGVAALGRGARVQERGSGVGSGPEPGGRASSRKGVMAGPGAPSNTQCLRSSARGGSAPGGEGPPTRFQVLEDRSAPRIVRRRKFGGTPCRQAEVRGDCARERGSPGHREPWMAGHRRLCPGGGPSWGRTGRRGERSETEATSRRSRVWRVPLDPHGAQGRAVLDRQVLGGVQTPVSEAWSGEGHGASRSSMFGWTADRSVSRAWPFTLRDRRTPTPPPPAPRRSRSSVRPASARPPRR